MHYIECTMESPCREAGRLHAQQPRGAVARGGDIGGRFIDSG